MDPLRHVKFFASVKHGTQKYSTGLPYTHHLAAVEEVLRRFGVTDQATLEAAWCHDIVEDTDTKVKEVAEMFGHRVAELVAAVTNESGENRKVRAAKTYPKILATPGAVTLKLADRIANVETGGELVLMYAKEHDTFKRNLYTAGENETMWAHLERLFENYLNKAAAEAAREREGTRLLSLPEKAHEPWCRMFQTADFPSAEAVNFGCNCGAASATATWSPGDYVALGPTLKPIASAPSRQKAKEDAIRAGCTSPLIVLAKDMKDVRKP